MMYRRLRQLLAAAIGSLLILSTARASTADDTALAQWQAQRQMMDLIARRAKPIDVHRMSDLLQIRVENRLLSLHTNLESTGQNPDDAIRAKLDVLAGPALLHVQRQPAQKSGWGVPASFSLNSWDYPRPRQSTTLTMSMAAGPFDVLTLCRSDTRPDGTTQQIVLTQQHGLQSIGGGMVQLDVVLGNGLRGTQQIHLTGRDFLSFLSEHPEATAQYVRPLFRALGQEPVFTPDPLTSWQVFSDLWTPDATALRKVKGILPKLDAEDYHARDAALAELQQLGREGASVLLHLDRSTLTAEQNARIDRALGPYSRLSTKEAFRLRSTPEFLLDCLYSDDLAIRKSALNRLRTITRPDLQFDVTADAPARVAAVAALRQQLLPPVNGK